MTQISFRTRILNILRNTSKLPVLENYLVKKTQGKSSKNLFAKLIPNNYQYPSKTIRRCSRDGVKYELDISDYMQYCIYYGIQTEPRERLYNLVKNGTTVIDVGTNIGETLLNFAKFNNDGTNIGFEPVPFLYEHAEKHIKINDFENIILENVALSNSFAELNFNFGDENNSGGIYLTENNGDSPDKTRIVKAEPLDHYVGERNFEDISLIKIDVEGFEMNVLQGAKETLKKFRPALFVEINDGFLRRQGSSAKILFDFLWSLGYEIFYVESQQPVLKDDSFEHKHFDVIAKSN